MRTEKATFTNMCMISRNDGKILVQNRLDPKWPGISFPGGHVELGESFVDSVTREVKEETGLDIKNPQLCGMKQFTTEATGRYIVIFFKTNDYSGVLRSSHEGDVFWISPADLKNYPLSEDFLEMYQVFTTSKNELFYFQEDGSWYHKLN